MKFVPPSGCAITASAPKPLTSPSSVARVLYHHKRHPQEMGVDEIRQYLSHLAVDGQVAASTQNVALSALLFLYQQVLHIELPLVDGVERAKRPQRVPVVLTREEVRRVLAHLSGTHHLMASLLYGAGVRLMECVRLRVKDVDARLPPDHGARWQRRA